jgi:hypothetical protein
MRLASSRPNTAIVDGDMAFGPALPARRTGFYVAPKQLR